MAIALSHDVATYSLANGSPVYMCSLDAEGAFDCIPHEVLFYKLADKIPDHCWRLLHHWYTNMSVRVRWNSQLSDPIVIMSTTLLRQLI